jgi:hypothetical protein
MPGGCKAKISPSVVLGNGKSAKACQPGVRSGKLRRRGTERASPLYQDARLPLSPAWSGFRAPHAGAGSAPILIIFLRRPVSRDNQGVKAAARQQGENGVASTPRRIPAWLARLPESLEGSSTAEKLHAITQIDLDELPGAITHDHICVTGCWLRVQRTSQPTEFIAVARFKA